MSDEQKAKWEEEFKRGELARQVLDNPVYRDAFLRMKADLLSGFETSGSNQDEERREIWRMIKTLNKLEAQLNQTMQTGELARRSLLQKVKDFF